MLDVEIPKFSKKNQYITQMPSLQGQNVEHKREEIRNYFHKTFTLSEKLYECLKNDEAFYQKPNRLRHPLIFYFGHTAVFFVNKLFTAGWIPQRIDEKLEASFAIGVDEMSWDDLDEKNYDWPSVASVKKYREAVRSVVDEFIANAPLELPITWDNPFWLILMGIEHERIHIETSSVLIRELDLKYVSSHSLFPICNLQGDEAPVNTFVSFQGGNLELGKSFEDPYYGWDNEYGKQKFEVKPFRAAKYLVTNKEYLEFVVAKGYQTKEFWTPEGWQWKEYTNVDLPRFWVKKDESYFYRTITELIHMPWNWPVDINFHEAKAFCQWKSRVLQKKIRMPSEAEWMYLRQQIDADQPTWSMAPGNINLEYWASACPVDLFPFKNGLYDLIGNVWQWTETPIYALPGFEVHPAYDDFSVPTFDDKHQIIKGGCFISTGNYALKNSRYAFRAHFYQHAGLRYIESEFEPQKIPKNPYESDGLINQYMEFHFGSEYFDTKNFAEVCAQRCLQFARQKEKALDLGCAVGRSTFELAREFNQVDGIDFSARFIQCAVEMQKMGFKKYCIPSEGDLFEFKEANLTKIHLINTAHRCRFMQGDACNLDPKYSGYDLIFAGNLIDRLYQPQLFLDMIHERINTNGILILTSPYTWLEDYTPKENWLGGYKKNGENIFTFENLKNILSQNFKFVDREDVPFIIRETKRKFQHTIAEM
ncbi:MAG: 5-histidylcysteine sulfoxide synthase [Bdellovibrionales bacterium]|nr:5-histidylcysteine sulfoxide synthase [Bdellovibrionales bacterium]